MSTQDGRGDNGRFLPENEIWTLRRTPGRKPAFEGPEQLWQACCSYFEWARSSPLLEAKVLASGEQVSVARMRAFTQRALCLFLGISEEAWRSWRANRPDLSEVITAVDAVIYTQKFEGAAAGLLNQSIIARDLGLAEKNELTGKGGDPIQVVSDEDVARRLAFLLTRADRAMRAEKD